MAICSKSLYHNFYGAFAAVPGAGYADASVGDLYYNTTDGNMYVCTNAAGPVWTALAYGGFDKRESVVIIGNSTAGDTNANSDFLGDVLCIANPAGWAPTTAPGVGGLGNVTRYGIQAAFYYISGRTRGARIFMREGTYAPSNAGCLAVNVGPPAVTAMDAPIQLSQMITAPTGPIVFEGAGREATIFINAVTPAIAPKGVPAMILDHPTPTTSVLVRNMTVRGNGEVTGIALNGAATIEIGNSGYGINATPASIVNNVTFEFLTVDGYNGATYDARAVFIANISAAAGANFVFNDCIFKNAGRAGTPNPPGVFQDGLGAVNNGSTGATWQKCKFFGGQVAGNASGMMSYKAINSAWTNCVFGGSAVGEPNGDSGLKADTGTNINVTACQAIANTCSAQANSGGFAFVGGNYIRISSSYAADNSSATANFYGWQYRFFGANYITVNGCEAVGQTSAGSITRATIGFVFDTVTFTDVVNCISNRNGNPNGTPNNLGGFGFLLSVTGVTTYVNINGCQGTGNDNWGLLFDSVAPASASFCQVNGGTFVTNGIALRIRAPSATRRMFTTNAFNQANVMMDGAVAVNQTEAAHFIFN